MNQDRRIQGIIEYWNDHGLASAFSSTSSGDADLACLDNALENRTLTALLTSRSKARTRCLDIGSGYGRFIPTLRTLYDQVVLLDAAPKVYQKLLSLWDPDEHIEVHNCTFERYLDTRQYDLVFASGVLYLYDNSMVDVFAGKAVHMLRRDGLFVLRDFISVPDHLVPSEYVQGGFCYYRSPEFWMRAADHWGLRLLEITRSKPRLRFLRSPRVLGIARRVGLTKVLRQRLAVTFAVRLGDFEVRGGDVQTVFIVMELR